MADTSQQSQGRYALVNSFYGPGSIACWYLTIVSVLLAWSLNTKKRRSGSIDIDLVAVLVVPTVACGHLITQIPELKRKHDAFLHDTISLVEYTQQIAAIEAIYTVVETFMVISVVMTLFAMWTFSTRRAFLIALVGLLCLATECFIYFSGLRELGIRYRPSTPQANGMATFNRSFVADFVGIIIGILAILALCTGVASIIMVSMPRSKGTSRSSRGELAELGTPAEGSETSHELVTIPVNTYGGNRTDAIHTRPTTVRAPQGRRQQRALTDNTMMESHKLRIITLIGFFAAFPAVLLSSFPSTLNSVTMYRMLFYDAGQRTSLWSSLKVFAAHFYPQSSNSFSDLDQAVVTATGVTVLGFSVYSIIKERHEARNNRRDDARVAWLRQ